MWPTLRSAERRYLWQRRLDQTAGDLVPFGGGVLALYHHPRLYDAATGGLAAEWPDLATGESARRSEHVHCAGGREVLAAGEITFSRDGPAWRAEAATNHSTGYCPTPQSWPAVAAALDRAGIAHPAGYQPVAVFRRCPACQAINIVRHEHFACAICDATLPQQWNITQAPP